MTLDFGQTDEHRMLAESLVRFLGAEGDFDARSRRLAMDPPQRMGLWQGLAELGVLTALAPEEAGGFGGAPHDMAVVMSTLAPSLTLEPVLVSNVVCRRLIQAAGPQFADLQQAIVSGEAVVALAYGEAFDAFAAPRLRAARTSEGYVLDGSKPCVRHADVVTHLLVGAEADTGPALFLVPFDAPGLHVVNARLIDGAGCADLHVEAVTAAMSSRLPISDVPGAVEDALEWGLGGLAIETASLMEAVNQATFEFLRTRRQFGQRLADFQALQHKAADMAIAAEEAAAMASTAIQSLQAPPSPGRSIAVLRASIACDRLAQRAAHVSIQLFGGMGVSDETPVSHYARRLAAIRAQIGTVDARASRLSRLEGSYG